MPRYNLLLFILSYFSLLTSFFLLIYFDSLDYLSKPDLSRDDKSEKREKKWCKNHSKASHPIVPRDWVEQTIRANKKRVCQ
jgi:hypothetical protein